MAFCAECGSKLTDTAIFGGGCGTSTGRAQTKVEVLSPARPQPAPPMARPLTYAPAPTASLPADQHHKGGFIQAYGLDIRVAILAVIVDTMVFGTTAFTGGILYIIELIAGFVLAFLTYKMQKNWYGDDHDSALIKAGIIGLLTAIPVPITGLFAVPGGALGIVHLFQRKK